MGHGPGNGIEIVPAVVIGIVGQEGLAVRHLPSDDIVVDPFPAVTALDQPHALGHFPGHLVEEVPAAVTAILALDHAALLVEAHPLAARAVLVRHGDEDVLVPRDGPVGVGPVPCVGAGVVEGLVGRHDALVVPVARAVGAGGPAGGLGVGGLVGIDGGLVVRIGNCNDRLIRHGVFHVAHRAFHCAGKRGSHHGKSDYDTRHGMTFPGYRQLQEHPVPSKKAQDGSAPTGAREGPSIAQHEKRTRLEFPTGFVKGNQSTGFRQALHKAYTNRAPVATWSRAADW